MMDFSFLKKKEVVALDIGSSSIKIVQLNQAKKGWELIKLGIAYLPPEAIPICRLRQLWTVPSSTR
jgi:type IV pilus assembly protein PilM